MSSAPWRERARSQSNQAVALLLSSKSLQLCCKARLRTRADNHISESSGRSKLQRPTHVADLEAVTVVDLIRLIWRRKRAKFASAKNQSRANRAAHAEPPQWAVPWATGTNVYNTKLLTLSRKAHLQAWPSGARNARGLTIGFSSRDSLLILSSDSNKLL